MEVRVTAVTAIALFSVSLTSSAAIDDWTAIGPTGGTVNKIVFSSNGSSAYMAAAAGYYRSTDSGVSWQAIKSDFFNAPVDIAIDPSGASRVYVVAPSAPCLYVSTDGGATLTASATLPPAVTQAGRIAVSYDGTTLYLSNDGRIFFSMDRGQTWQERTALSTDASTAVLKLLIDPNDPKTLYAAAATASTGNEGIFATHDGAMTWQQVTSGTEAASLTADLAINPSNSNQIWSAQYDGVWVSADKGVHWSNVLATTMFAIAIDPTNPMVVYAGTPFGKVYRSANSGVNWADVSGNILAGEEIHLAVNPVQSTKVLAGGFAGVSGSNTSGTTWLSQQAGFLGTNISGFSADPQADRIYVNLRSNGVFYTVGGAASTQPVNNTALLNLSSIPTIDVTAILAQPGRLFASLNNGLTFSPDGGSTWAAEVQVLPLLPGTQQVFRMTSTAAAPQNILAASNAAIFRSPDRGATWQAVTGVPPNGTVTAFRSSPNIFMAPSNPSLAYAAFYSTNSALGVYKSTDAGSSWSLANPDIASGAAALLAVDPSNEKTLYGLGTGSDRSLLKSIDGGGTWSILPWDSTGTISNPNVLSVDPVHTNILYAASGQRIGRSVDGGSSWETLRGSAAPFWFPNDLIADPNRPENLLVGTDRAGVQLITIAPDLTLAVNAPANVGIGATATYIYTVTNQGPFDATGVKVTIQLPSSAQIKTPPSTDDGTCTVAGPTIVTCVFPILRKGANSSLTASAVAPLSGPFQVSASVLGDQPDSDPADNAVTSNAMVETLSDMSVTAMGPSAAHVGDALTYTLLATNAGPNIAPAAQLTFQMAAGLTPGTVSSSDATCTSAATGQVTCNLNDLAVAKAVTVAVNATAAAAGAQTLTARVTTSANDPASANNTATAATTVSAVVPPAAGGGGGLSLYELFALATMLLLGRFRGAFY